MNHVRKLVAALVCSACVQVSAGQVAFAQGVLPPEVREGVSGELVWHDTSGGATSRARNATIEKSFTAETGVTLKADFNADMTKFFAAMESDAPIPWSMVEFPTKGDFIRARDAGYLEKLDPKVIDFSKLERSAYDEYGVDVMRYGIVLTYNTEKFSGETAPTSMRDIYDVEKFPGKRCLFKYPQFGAVLESALLADGAAGDALYPLDLDRAFAKLDKIKSDIIWWGNGDEAIRLLASGECSIGIAWSGRVYSAVKNDSAPLAMVWKDSLYAQAVYGIPRGAPNAAAAQALIAHFIADTEAQKALVREIPYTTAIVALDASSYGEEMLPWIVAGDNAKVAFLEDAGYYSAHLPEVVDRFNRWIVMN